MKLNLAILSLLALTTSSSVVLARDNAPATDTNAPAATAPAAAAPTDSTPAPAPALVAIATPVVQPAPAISTPADVSSTNAPATRDPSAIIPLIVMDEVPLTDAIKNLARQANLNFMLNPKVSYGTPDANGTVHAQPTVSLRWENLTAEQALNAVLNNYNLVIIDDPKTHIAQITVKDPAAPDPLVTKIIQLKYSDASNMVASVQSVLIDKRSKAIADERTSQLVLVATEREMVEADQLVARLDSPTKEVLIEAKLVELQKNPSTTKGIDWSGTLGAQHITFGNGTTTGTYTSASGNTTANNAGTGTLPVGAIAPPFIAGNPSTLSTTVVSPGGVTTTTASATGTGNTSGSVNGHVLSSLVGNGGLSLNTAKGLFPATAFLNADGVNAVLSFLNTEADAKILSTPRAVTLDNQEAILSVTTAQPIFKTTAGTQGSPGGAEVTYTNLGTILKVTPRISANNTINLRVVPEVSSLGGVVTKTVSGLVSQADFFDVRKIDTRVVIPSGNTLVMGGLVSDSSTKGVIKVPLLGDIPFFGAAFRQESKTQNKRNLIIFVTPTIVQNEDFQPTETAFLKTKVPDGKGPDFNAWDSGAPQDWSKLMHSKKNAAKDDAFADFPTTK